MAIGPVGERWEVVVGDRVRWRPTLRDNVENIPPLPVGCQVWLIVTNTIAGGAGGFTRQLTVLDAAKAQVEWDPALSEVATVGVFRMRIKVIVAAGTSAERVLTFPHDEDVALVVRSA